MSNFAKLLRLLLACIAAPLAVGWAFGLPRLALGVMKDSALVYVVQVTELLKSTQILITRLQEPLFLLLICGAFYFLISFPLAVLCGWVAQREMRHHVPDRTSSSGASDTPVDITPFD